VRRLTVEMRDELAAQVEQIAGLAPDGLSNPGDRRPDCLSAHPGRMHLKKVFTKLGIRSRDQGI
jgi:ATP/maltotriose-dependent transcriptional regulator MalT